MEFVYVNVSSVNLQDAHFHSAVSLIQMQMINIVFLFITLLHEATKEKSCSRTKIQMGPIQTENVSLLEHKIGIITVLTIVAWETIVSDVA